MNFHWYGFFLGLGIVAGIHSAQWLVERANSLLSKHIDAISLWVVVGGVIGARVYHLITDAQLYVGASFVDLIAVWRGGLGLWGALIGGLCGLFLYAKKHFNSLKSFMLLVDGIGFGLPIAQLIGRIGNGINQELYGTQTTLPWGISIQRSTEKYHPLFAYEGILLLVLWFVLRWSILNNKISIGSGHIFSVWLIAYGLIRFILEFIRFSTAQLGIFSIAQWVSILAVLCGGIMLKRVRL